MSDQQQSVWPEGAREAVQTVVYQWVRDQWGDSVDIAGLILATLAPYLQQRTQRMAEALSDINELVPPPPVGVSQSMADRLRLMVAQRDAQRGKSESLVAALRAEVARLREDGERLDWLSGILQGNDPELGQTIGDIDLRGSWEVVALEVPNTCAVQAPNLRAAIDAARSARGGEG